MKTILVVEDEVNMRDLIIRVLQEQGFKTLGAEDGMSGIELARKHLPDLIICDVMMDNVNGFMVLEMLRESPETARIPVVMMTGVATGAGAWRADPAVKYLAKPFASRDLLRFVNESLRLPSEK